MTGRRRALAATLTLLLLAGCGLPQPGTATPLPRPPLAPEPSAAPASPSVTLPSPGETASANPTTQPSATTQKTAKPSAPATQKTTVPAIPASGALAGMVVAAGAMGRPSTGGATLAPTASGPLSGRTIMVDPGHNGTYVASINTRQVPAGGGATKDCNTSGTTGADGTPEYAITWDVGLRLVALLRSKGAKVVLTRPNNTGVGPCVDERAGIANRSGVDLVLSIHGDGNYTSTARGFHVIVSTAMAGSGLSAKSKSVAQTLVSQLKAKTALPPSNYIGGGTGIAPRSDIAGLNLLSGAPGVLLEMGNLRNSTDWDYLKTSAAKDALAASLAETAVATLG